MFKDFEQKTDKLTEEFNLRIPELMKHRLEKVDASRKKVLNKYIIDLLDQFLYGEDYQTVRGKYLNSDL